MSMRVPFVPDDPSPPRIPEPRYGPLNTWTFGQHWRASPDPGFEPGRVCCGWNHDALLVAADLVDRQCLSSATADHQNMWELGDTFEVFIMANNASSYLELHVTPNDHCLQLLFTATGKGQRDKKTLAGRRFRFVSRHDPATGTWHIRAAIPWTLVHAAGQPVPQFRLSFGRYDAYADGTPTVISSTSPHTACDFHQPDDWTTTLLEEAAP